VKSKHPFRDQALPVLLVVFFIVLLLVGVWSPGSWRGIDTWGHAFRAEYLAGVMRSEGIGAYFRAAWMPNWYMGDPFLTYYPPLTTLLLAPLIFVLSNPDAAVRILLSFFFLTFSLLTFLYVDRTFNRWAAFLGTVLAVGAPYQMRTIFFEGNLPRMLSLLALPAIALLSDRLLAPRTRRAPAVVLLGLCWTWSILAHPQQAVIFAIGVGFYLILRLILDPEVPLFALGPWAASVLLGALFAAPWLLPAYSRAELTNIPYLPLEKIPLFSTSLEGFLPYLDLTHGQVLFGYGSLLIGVLAIAVRPDPRRTAWYLAGLLAISFSLGPSGVFFSLLPLHNQLLPERFINFAAFGIPVAAAGLLPMGRNLRAIRTVLLVILVTAELIPSARILPGTPYPQEQAVLQSVADPGGGRVALLTYPEPTSLEVYFAGTAADLINGWALENTPHHTTLRRVLSAPDWGPDYLESLFSRWDVRTVVISGGAEADGAREFAEAAGFTRMAAIGRYEIWRAAAASARVQAIPEQSMLLVGDSLSSLLAAFPFAEEATAGEFSAAQSGRLGEYPVIGLYRFASNPADVESLETQFRNYLEAGGTLVVDLSGMEDLFGQTLTLFGVNTLRMAFHDSISLHWVDETAGLPATLPLSGLSEKTWSGAVYEGLDSVLAYADVEDSSFPVFGYRSIGKGKVWFIGGNLLYYAQQTGQDDYRRYLRASVLAGTSLSTDLGMPPVPIQGYVETADGLRFDYAADSSVHALVSYTYSPRWRAEVDGVPVGISSRDHLIRLFLPPGAHHVEIRYDPFGTVWPGLGWLAGFFAVICCAAGWIIESARGKTESPSRDLLDVFQKPEHPEDGGAFTPCAHCGFRLAESRPPTPITYPFHVSSCPICEARMDDEGFFPGKELSREEQARALHRWMRVHNYDPRVIHTQWGFSVEEFFKQ
jgi:hypothetical protein